MAATISAQAANGGPFYGGTFDIALNAFINDNLIPINLPSTGKTGRCRWATTCRSICKLRQVTYYVLTWLPLSVVRRTDLDGVKPPIVNSTLWKIVEWQF